MNSSARVEDLAYLLPNVTRLVRQSVRLVDRHFPATDQELTTYLLAACSNPAVTALLDHVDDYCERHGGRLPGTSGDQGATPFVRKWLLASRVLSDISGQTQAALPHINDPEDYQTVLYTSRVTHDASVGCTQKVQELLPQGVVATPYRLFVQEEEGRARAESLRKDLREGRTVSVFRVVSVYGNHLQWSPFWTLGEPNPESKDTANPESYLCRNVVPPSRLVGPIAIVRGRVGLKASFVVEPGIAYTQSAVRPDILITTYDGVELESPTEVNAIVKARVRPSRFGERHPFDESGT